MNEQYDHDRRLDAEAIEQMRNTTSTRGSP